MFPPGHREAKEEEEKREKRMRKETKRWKEMRESFAMADYISNHAAYTFLPYLVPSQGELEYKKAERLSSSLLVSFTQIISISWSLNLSLSSFKEKEIESLFLKKKKKEKEKRNIMVAKIAVVIYTLYGHTTTLSESVVAGLKESGAEVEVFQFKEILSDEVREKMYAGPKLDLPVLTAADLPKFDGFLFGFGTRYGRAPAAVSAFFDTTGGLWASGSLVGKFAGVFFGTASSHGGQETTALTTIPFFAHHGIIYVPIGFARPELSISDKVTGGSAYGAGYVAGGKGELPVTEEDKVVGHYQGQSFGTLVNTFVKGRDL